MFQAWHNECVEQNTDEARLIKACEKNIIERFYKAGEHDTHYYCTADPIAMATALNKSVVKEVAMATCMVEMHSPLARGHCIVDWSGKFSKGIPKVNIVKEIDLELFKAMLMNSLGERYYPVD